VLYLPQLLREVDGSIYVFPLSHNDFHAPLKNFKRVALRADLNDTLVDEIIYAITTNLFPVIEELFIIVAHCGQESFSKLEHGDNAKDPWAFVDVSLDEILGCYPGYDCGLQSLRKQIEAGLRGDVGKWTKNFKRDPEEIMEEFFPGNPFSVPQVRIGLMMPESKVDHLLRLREERRRGFEHTKETEKMEDQ
jgi:hypothetical protein